MQDITPFLWFESEAAEAADFYTSVFKDSEILGTQYYPEGAPLPAGTILTVTIRIRDFQLIALNGGPHDKFNEAISFMVKCDDQAEVDYYWSALLDGGKPSQCGWLKDRFGVAWQVVPVGLFELLSDPDPGRAGRATQAMMKMSKIELAEMEAAANSAS